MNRNTVTGVQKSGIFAFENGIKSLDSVAVLNNIPLPYIFKKNDGG